MDEPISRNFTAYELRCKCDLCRREVPSNIDRAALAALQKMRDDYGKAIRLTSAYRCEMHPKEIRKEKPGTHNQGIAFDIKVPWGRDRMELLRLALKHGFKGYGFAESFIHIDFRNGVHTSWSYGR
jgi:uncharacterized protein YcbK (DUF882 family)